MDTMGEEEIVTVTEAPVMAGAYVELRAASGEHVLHLIVEDWRAYGEPQSIEEFRSPACVAKRAEVAKEREAMAAAPAPDPEPRSRRKG
jgi:hypothetical protein